MRPETEEVGRACGHRPRPTAGPVSTPLSAWQRAILIATWVLAAASVGFFGALGILIETAADPCIGGGCGTATHVAFAVTSVVQVGLLAGATWLATRGGRAWSVRVGGCAAVALLAPVVLVVGAFVSTALA